MGRKAVEMGRYGASELMRNKKLQKKAVNYGIRKLTPLIHDSVGTAMDQLSEPKLGLRKSIKLIERIWTDDQDEGEVEKELLQWMWLKKLQISR